MPARLFYFLAFLGLLSGFALSSIGPTLALILALTGVGLPIVLLMMVAPTLFVVLAASTFTAVALGGRWWSYMLGGAIALLLLAIVPYVYNQDLVRSVEAIAEADADNIVQRKLNRVAIIVPRRFSANDPLCGGLCQRILLNGNVDELVIAEAKSPNVHFGSLSGASFRRQLSASCSVTNFDKGGPEYSPPGERRNQGDPTPADLLTLQALAGNCVVQSVARVDSADAVLLINATKHEGDPTSGGWSFSDWTIKTKSLILLQKLGGTFRETYRRSVILYDPLAPILFATVTDTSFNGFGKNAVGFLRVSKVLGTESIYSPQPSMGDFLRERLGFDLSLHDKAARKQVQSFAEWGLRAGAGSSVQAREAAKILFKSIGRGRPLDDADIDLALHILADNAIALPDDADDVTRVFVKQRPELAEKLAASLFARFEALVAEPLGAPRSEQRYELYRVASAIKALPAQSVAAYGNAVTRVARDPNLRTTAGPLLQHVSSLGERGPPLALYLIEDSWRFASKKPPPSEEWQTPYLAGLTALCRMGPDAKSSLPQLNALRASGKIATFGSYERLWTRTLERLDGSPMRKGFDCTY